jgi:hypothetical protein
LRWDAPCLWLDSEGKSINLLWPPGFRFRTNTAEILSPTGLAVAKADDDVVVAGVPIDGHRPVLGCPSSQTVAAIAEIVEINGVRTAPTHGVPPRRPPPIR